MNQKQDRYRMQLEEKAEDLRQSLRRVAPIALERVPDSLDETTFAAAREAAALELERIYRLLHHVETALARLNAGKYGSCLKCEEEIAEKRLNAIPWAIYCIGCQEAVDRLHQLINARSGSGVSDSAAAA
jgi:DnaK suppressor protein